MSESTILQHWTGVEVKRMTSSNFKHDGKYGSSDDDSNSNESFESALCEMHEMYNDVLCDVFIPEDDEVTDFGQANKEGMLAASAQKNSTQLSRQDSCASFQTAFAPNMGLASSHTGKDRSSILEQKKMTYASRKDSFVSLRSSYALSIGSASTCILSSGNLGEDADLSYIDDDLSYITEPDLEVNVHILNDLKPNNRQPCRPTQIKRSNNAVLSSEDNITLEPDYYEDSESQKDVFSLTGLDIDVTSQSTFSPTLAGSEVSGLSLVASGQY